MLIPSFSPGPCHLACGAGTSRHLLMLKVSAMKCVAGIQAHLLFTLPVPSKLLQPVVLSTRPCLQEANIQKVFVLTE